MLFIILLEGIYTYLLTAVNPVIKYTKTKATNAGST